MHHPRLTLAALCLALSAGGAFAQTAPAGDAQRGARIFTSYGCYQCHGYQGQGTNAGSRIAPNPMPFAAIQHQLRTPRARMPAYPTKVTSDQDIADIYAYLVSIPKAKSVAEIPLLRSAP